MKIFSISDSNEANETETTTTSTSESEFLTTNGTTEKSSGIQFDAKWISYQGVTSVFSLLCIYLTVALMYHQYRSSTGSKQKQRDNWNTATFPRNRGNHNSGSSRSAIGQSSKGSRRRFITLQVMTVLSAVLVTIRSLSEQLTLFYGNASDYHCSVIPTIHIVFYAAPIATLYSALWLRQRIMYLHPCIKSNSPPAVRVISWLILLLMVIGATLTALIFTLTISYKKGEDMCIKHDVLPMVVPWILILIFTSAFQIMLLGLFIFPLVKQTQDMRSANVITHGPSFRSAIWRATIATSVCIISDTTAFVVTLLTEGQPIVSNLTYDLNLIVNLICIVCCFSNWRERIFPFCVSLDHEHNTEIAIVSNPRLDKGIRNISFDSCDLRPGECEDRIHEIQWKKYCAIFNYNV